MPREPRTTLTNALRHFPLFSASARPSAEGEVRLYVRRALRAASEERFDVAIVFCEKALELAPADLAARLLVARLYDHVSDDVDRAIAAYRKVITLAGYDAANPYCAAAREALDSLIESCATPSVSPDAEARSGAEAEAIPTDASADVPRPPLGSALPT